MCIAIAAAVAALACYERPVHGARSVVGQAFALLHTRSWDGRTGGGAAMAVAGKIYLVEDVEPEAALASRPGLFRGTVAGLLDALDAARYRSALPGRDPH